MDFHVGPDHGACIRLLERRLLTLCAVWCWGWDGAGDLEGPDVEPIWEKMSNKSYSPDAILVKHNRAFELS